MTIRTWPARGLGTRGLRPGLGAPGGGPEVKPGRGGMPGGRGPPAQQR